MPEFQFKHFRFSLNTDHTWNLVHSDTGIGIKSVLPRIDLVQNGLKMILQPPAHCTSPYTETRLESPFKTPSETVSIQYMVDNIAVITDFAFPTDFPLFLIKTTITNLTSETIQSNSFEMVNNAIHPEIQFRFSNPELSCFVNGWQSWSYSGTYLSKEKQRVPGLNFIEGPLWHDHATPIFLTKGKFSSDFFTVIIDKSTKKGLLAGFLSQKQQFGHAEIDLREGTSLRLVACADGVQIPAGESLSTDWAAIQVTDFTCADPLGDFINAAALVNNVELPLQIPTGWCSWYHYYTHITPDNLLSNIRLLNNFKKNIPLDLIQIDDGFERAVGDWLEFKPDFPDGLSTVTDEIRKYGSTPGLWLAPFIVHPSSNLYKDHREMLLKDRFGKLVNSGWNWNDFTTSLDMSHPAAKEYVRNVIDTAVNKWGFPYLKLDFLYAATIPGKHYDPTLTRAQIYDRAMQIIRKAAGKNTFLLGCGAPIGAMIGHVDGMRIGTDVASDWKPKYHGVEILFPNEPNIPSVENAMQNTITRGWFHNRWWMNDPDCLLLRSTTHLTEDEVQTQASLTAMTGGMVLFSDDLSQIPPERMRLLQELLPVIGKTPQIIDWHEKLTPSRLRVDLTGPTGDWHLICYTNWKDQSFEPNLTIQDFNLPSGGSWLVSSFREGKFLFVDNEALPVGNLPSHATWIAAIRKKTKTIVQYAGSSLHISQGMEVIKWEDNGELIEVVLNLPREADGIIVLHTSFQNISIETLNGETIPFERNGDFLMLHLQFKGETSFNLRYG